jgi:exodeoxyribonuclease VII small subunit
VPPTDANVPSFEESLAELEAVLRALEDGSTGLEESLACYEKGVGLLKHCYGQLRRAEQRVLLVTGDEAAGQPFNGAPTAEAPAALKRTRPRITRPGADAEGLF